MDAETLYHEVGQLVQTIPSFTYGKTLSKDDHLWLGRAGVLVEKYGDVSDKAAWAIGMMSLNTVSQHETGVKNITTAIYKVLAAAELRAPPHIRGAFIPVGNSFGTFAAIAKVMEPARVDILIVDPYLDETVLTDFAGTAAQGVALRLLADAADHKPTLKTAASRWATQYGTTRPLAVRLGPAKTLHDRVIFIDRKVAWTITQSLKDIAKRSPASIVRIDDETAALKIAAYEAAWKGAQVIL